MVKKYTQKQSRKKTIDTIIQNVIVKHNKQIINEKRSQSAFQSEGLLKHMKV